MMRLFLSLFLHHCTNASAFDECTDLCLPRELSAAVSATSAALAEFEILIMGEVSGRFLTRMEKAVVYSGILSVGHRSTLRFMERLSAVHAGLAENPDEWNTISAGIESLDTLGKRVISLWADVRSIDDDAKAVAFTADLRRYYSLVYRIIGYFRRLQEQSFDLWLAASQFDASSVDAFLEKARYTETKFHAALDTTRAIANKARKKRDRADAILTAAKARIAVNQWIFYDHVVQSLLAIKGRSV